MNPEKISFTATIIQVEGMNAGYVEFPFSVEKVFESLSYTHRKEYINWITSAKKDETRANRIVSFIEKLHQKKKPDQK